MCENTKKKARSIEMVTGSLWKNIFLIQHSADVLTASGSCF
mgnify:CR=1 FL=1